MAEELLKESATVWQRHVGDPAVYRDRDTAVCLAKRGHVGPARFTATALPRLCEPSPAPS